MPSAREAHLNECLDAQAAEPATSLGEHAVLCSVCNQNLGPLTATARDVHVNRCLDKTLHVVATTRERVTSRARTGSLRLTDSLRTPSERGRAAAKRCGPEICVKMKKLLEMVGLERYEKRFVAQEVDIVALQLLEDGDWAELGLPDGARRRITDAAREAKLLEIDTTTSGPNMTGGVEDNREDGSGIPKSDDDDDSFDNLPATQRLRSSKLAATMARREGHLLAGLAGRFIAEEEINEDLRDDAWEKPDDLVETDFATVRSSEKETPALSTFGTAQSHASRGYTQLESLLNEEGMTQFNEERAVGTCAVRDAADVLEPEAARERTAVALHTAVVYVDGDTPPATVEKCPAEISDGKANGREVASRLGADASASMPVDIIEISPDPPRRPFSVLEERVPFSPHPALGTPQRAPDAAMSREDEDAGRRSERTETAKTSGLKAPIRSPPVGKDTNCDNLIDWQSRVSHVAKVRNSGLLEDNARNANSSPNGGSLVCDEGSQASNESGILDLAGSDKSNTSPGRVCLPAGSSPANGCRIQCPYKTVADVNRWYTEIRNEEIRHHRAQLMRIESERERACKAAEDFSSQNSSSQNSSPSSVLGKRAGTADRETSRHVRDCEKEVCHNFDEEADDRVLDLTQRGDESDCCDDLLGISTDDHSGSDVAVDSSRSERSSSAADGCASGPTAACTQQSKTKKSKRKKNVVARPPAAQDENLIAVLRRNPELYDKILVVEPVALDAVMGAVKQAGYRISVANLAGFLDRQGVNYKVSPKPLSNGQREYMKQLNSQL